jgi:Lrp/AsnC family transcriptional regulator for asnA, asnC and gidA
MQEKVLVSLEKRLIKLLGEDGQMPVSKLADDLGVTTPTVRFYLKNLIQSGILKIVGLINASKAKDLSEALVGIKVDKHPELNEKLMQISNLNNVHWAAVVTGQYDIIVEVILVNGMNDLYKFVTEDLPTVGGIQSTETFVIMKSERKLVLPSFDIEAWEGRF